MTADAPPPPATRARESDADVLIIGAGPAGLMCALALARAGVHVRIVDKRPPGELAGQADGIQPRTIEVLQSYGLAERLLREGNHMYMAAFYNPGPDGGIERTSRVPDVTAPTARYPFEVTLYQGAIEAIFSDSMRAMGLAVERPVVPVSITLSDDPQALRDPRARPVTVVLKRESESGEQHPLETVHAKFVVGADGAHSWVRKELEIEMEGEQTDFVWGVVDMVPTTDFPDIRNKSAIHSHNGSCMVIPREEDRVRLYIQLADVDVRDPVTGRVDKERMGPDKLLEVARKTLHPYTLEKPEAYNWWTIYQIGQRVASKFSVHERIFIAGDACHTHSPKAGQGMNASMNDTHNLAWKIVLVLKGLADVSLLKTYEFERKKYAQNLIDFDRKFSTLFSGKPQTEEFQDGISHEEFVLAFQTFGGFSSGIGVHYASSPITDVTHQSCAPHLVIGQRVLPQIVLRAADARPYELQDLLPSNGRFKLLVFAGDVADGAQRARVDALARALGRPECFLQRFARPGADALWKVDVITVCATKKTEIDFTELPAVFRPHWAMVFTDDTDVTGTQGGKAYETFGVGPAGMLAVVRPDGYVGTMAPLDRTEDLDSYFLRFMVPQ